VARLGKETIHSNEPFRFSGTVCDTRDDTTTRADHAPRRCRADE
jgi:hypothetical protein